MRIASGQHTWADVEPFLDELLDTPPADREAWLARLAEQKPSMAAALRELLTERDELEAKGFLEQSVAVPAQESMIGRQIGAYTIESLIGRGGMGEVWLAQRSDGRFEGQFAIKFLDSYANSAVALDRFRREGRLLARLAHPHIARLIDAGVTAERPYLVLEYVDGERIDRFCESRSLGVEARVRLFLDVLAAVAHAHSNLIVHRDIKPSNVLISSGGGVKLLDFGIAKLLSSEHATEDQSALTRVEDAAFTPDYAAPEQILGEPASTATDVYQLGVLLFALLSGRLPLVVSGTTRTERIKSALDSEPSRLSDAAPKSLRKSLRGDLDAVVAKALRKLPQERYAAAAALAADLQRFLEHEPVSARAGALAYRTRKFVRRYRGAVIGTAAAMLALIAATTFAWIQMREAQVQRDQSRQQARRAELQAEFVTLMMSTVGEGNGPTNSEQILDQGLELLDKHYPDDPAFRANMLINMSGRYMDLGKTQKEYAALLKAEAIARNLHDFGLIAEVECNTVETEIALGHQDAAAARLTLGRSALARVVEPGALNIEDCLEAEFMLEDAQGHTQGAIQTAEKAVALLERAGETHDVRYPALLSQLSSLYSNAGNVRKSFEVLERDLAAINRNGQADTDSGITALHNVAVTLMEFGEISGACAREGELINRLQTVGKAIKVPSAVTYGTCKLRLGRPSEALTWYEQALLTAQKDKSLLYELYAHGSRARALIALRRLEEAGAELDAAAALGKKDATVNRRPLLRAEIVRAELMLAQGRANDARRQIDPLLSKVRDADSGGKAYLGATLLLAGRIAIAEGRATDAEGYAKEALAGAEAAARNADSSADVGEALLVLAQARQARGDGTGMHEASSRAVVSLTNSLGADQQLTREALALRDAAIAGSGR